MCKMRFGSNTNFSANNYMISFRENVCPAGSDQYEHVIRIHAFWKLEPRTRDAHASEQLPL